MVAITLVVIIISADNSLLRI